MKIKKEIKTLIEIYSSSFLFYFIFKLEIKTNKVNENIETSKLRGLVVLSFAFILITFRFEQENQQKYVFDRVDKRVFELQLRKRFEERENTTKRWHFVSNQVVSISRSLKNFNFIPSNKTEFT